MPRERHSPAPVFLCSPSMARLHSCHFCHSPFSQGLALTKPSSSLVQAKGWKKKGRMQGKTVSPQAEKKKRGGGRGVRVARLQRGSVGKQAGSLRGAPSTPRQSQQLPNALPRDVIGQGTGERPHSLLATLSHQLHGVDGQLGHSNEDNSVL